MPAEAEGPERWGPGRETKLRVRGLDPGRSEGSGSSWVYDGPGLGSGRVSGMG